MGGRIGFKVFEESIEVRGVAWALDAGGIKPSLKGFLPGGGVAIEKGGNDFLLVLVEIFKKRLGGGFWQNKKAFVVDGKVATASFNSADQFINVGKHGNGL